MFVKVNNKVTSKTSLTSFCCLYLLTLNIICSFLVSLLHFWAGKCLLGTLILFKLSWGQFLWIETGNLCYVINVNPEATHHLTPQKISPSPWKSTRKTDEIVQSLQLRQRTDYQIGTSVSDCLGFSLMTLKMFLYVFIFFEVVMHATFTLSRWWSFLITKFLVPTRQLHA